MAEPRVLDSWALLCYLEREPGFQTVVDLLSEAAERDSPLLMSVINWGEVYYLVLRRFGEKRAKEVEALIQTFPVRIIDADMEITRAAARIKASGRMAYADCFAAALASQRGAALCTGDPEFRAVKDEIPMLWLQEAPACAPVPSR